MSSFTISPTLNKNKVFLLQKSELIDRWDPLMILYQRENQSFKYETKKLKNLIVSNPEYGAGEIGIERKTKTEPRYIRITDIDEFGLLSSDLGVTANTMEAKYFLNDNDFLFARSGATVGKAYLHKKDLVPYPCFYAGYMIRYRLNEKEILPEYLFAITQTRFYKNWVKAIQRPTGQPNINAEEFKSLSFPLPPKEIQQKVVNIFSRSYDQKKQNEAQAEKLLASIDDYLLKELGITLPAPPENILENRIYSTTIKAISGNRFDPFFHQKKFSDNIQAISNGKFPVKPLREIISGNLIKGTLPKQEEKGGNNSVVQINCINSDGTISLDDLLTAKDIFSKEQKLNIGDVLVVITGATIGKIAQWNYEGEYFLGGDIVKFQTNSLADNSFVFHFLRTAIIQTEIKRNVTGATNGHLAPEDVKHLPIPVPPLATQKEIADKITDIRKQAQQLKDKTKEALKKASEEIEKILLTK